MEANQPMSSNSKEEILSRHYKEKYGATIDVSKTYKEILSAMTEYRSIGEREAAIGFKRWCDKEGWTWNAGKNLRRGGVKNSIYLSYEQVYEIYKQSL